MSRCYTQITLADRRRLHHLVAANVPIDQMARRLGRHRSTIYREIKRNTFRDRELPATTVTTARLLTIFPRTDDVG
ncbi:IS30 family transposase [Rhizobium leguminosarum]|nr:IS30 family transposase [Rhizobium leguminosarum]MBP2447700.1 IS30 family transposase [Rhizobium leguminosarum]MBP2448625.1 IS30 family transposase [Rhizobium leguminosarum]